MTDAKSLPPAHMAVTPPKPETRKVIRARRAAAVAAAAGSPVSPEATVTLLTDEDRKDLRANDAKADIIAQSLAKSKEEQDAKAKEPPADVLMGLLRRLQSDVRADFGLCIQTDTSELPWLCLRDQLDEGKIRVQHAIPSDVLMKTGDNELDWMKYYPKVMRPSLLSQCGAVSAAAHVAAVGVVYDPKTFSIIASVQLFKRARAAEPEKIMQHANAFFDTGLKFFEAKLAQLNSDLDAETKRQRDAVAALGPIPKGFGLSYQPDSKTAPNEVKVYEEYKVFFQNVLPQKLEEITRFKDAQTMLLVRRSAIASAVTELITRTNGLGALVVACRDPLPSLQPEVSLACTIRSKSSAAEAANLMYFDQFRVIHEAHKQRMIVFEVICTGKCANGEHPVDVLRHVMRA